MIMFFGWMIAVALAIWWPRSGDGNKARVRAYTLLQRAASLHVLGFLLWILLLGIDPNDPYLLLILFVVSILGVISLTPFAVSMLGLDVGARWVGIAGTTLSVFFPTGVACYALLTLVGIYAGAAALWLIAPALGTLLLSGAAAWQLMEAYAVMRAPRARPSDHVDP